MRLFFFDFTAFFIFIVHSINFNHFVLLQISDRLMVLSNLIKANDEQPTDTSECNTFDNC